MSDDEIQTFIDAAELAWPTIVSKLLDQVAQHDSDLRAASIEQAARELPGIVDQWGAYVRDPSGHGAWQSGDHWVWNPRRQLEFHVSIAKSQRAPITDEVLREWMEQYTLDFMRNRVAWLKLHAFGEIALRENPGLRHPVGDVEGLRRLLDRDDNRDVLDDARDAAGRIAVQVRAEGGQSGEATATRPMSEKVEWIYEALREAGGRLTAEELAHAALGDDTASSTFKTRLGLLVELGYLTNKRDARGNGYGLTEWE